MDNKCNNSESEDLSKTVNNVEGAPIDPKTISRCESPVFRCFNQNKTNRVRYSDSSDYDIPSYQINQSVKRRNSSKHDSEKSDSILPFTPTFSPILTFSQQFQPPSIHSLGTVHKTVSLEEKDKTKISDKSLCDANKEEVKKRSAFESLGMMDKDISWISSMATPTPHIPGSEFNTVEKATFFPDEKFQNIQPRALFSPTFDDDFGCIPLSFSSESEGDESYRSNIRLSDVCATLKKLEVESSEQIPNVSEKSLNEENDRNCKTSPVIKMRKQKKYESLKKKKKQASAMSPELIHNCKFSTNENLGVEIVDEKLESNEVNNAISLNPNFMDDDSFQNISFTYIDELCKTLVNKTEQANCSAPSKTCEIKCDIVLQDKTNLKLPSKQPDDCIEKQFYKSKLDPDICAVSSLDNLHSYAQALEDGNGDIPNGRKIDKSVTEKGVVRFDAFAGDSCATFAAKRLHSELSVEKREIKITEKKFKKEGDESPKWSTMSKYPIECQLNVSDSEIIKTVEKLEKTISSQENKVSSDIKNEVKENASQLSIDEKVTSSTLEKSPNLKLGTILDLKGAVNPPKPAQEGSVVSTSITFKTASGSEIAVAEDALVKGKQVLAAVNDEWHLKQTSDELAKEWMEDFQDTLESFSSYGDKVETVQNKMDTLVLPDVTGEDSEISEVLTQDKEALVEFNKTEVSFQNINGREASTSEVESKEERMLEESNKVQISSEPLKKTRSLMSECEGSFKSENELMKGFSTASGSKVNVSSKALEKARALMSECEGSFESGKQLMKGFSTASGSKVNVSSAALEKARALMSECEGSFESGKQLMKGFSTASGSKVNVSSKALEKAKSLMSECEGSSKRICDNFVNDWMENFEIEDPAKSEASTDGEAIQKKPPPVCFSTASGSKVTVSEEALKKARESLAQVQNQKSPDNLKKFFSEKPDIELGSSKNIPLQEEKWEISSEEKNEGEPKPENSKMLNDLTVDEALLKEANQIEDDSEGIIPSWLHVYNTSPSLASDRVEMSPLISHEDGKSSNYSREYIVKSPVLGLSDRFYKKGKKRKREVTEEEAKVEPSVESKNFVVPYKNGGKKTGVKRSSLNCSMDFSAPFKKGKFLEGEIGSVEEVRQTSLDIRESRMKARVNQENAIKEKNKIKPLKGSHLQKKCSQKQIKWMEAVENSSPGVYTDEFLKSMGVKEDVLRVNVANAGDFKFNGEDFYGSTCANNVNGIPSGDGCFIIPDEENKFGVEEVKRAFLASPGVQPNLIPDGWVENHYKWLVWKFSHYERSFPRFFGGRCLNPNNVMLQLKYRYDREIDKNERSALKKILERDDTSAKRMVLCVCGIKKVTGEKMTEYELNLTDGWYSCPARCDSAMTRLIEEGKLPIGMKLVTQGAVLVNCEQGTTPLEMSGDVHLKIFTNSTRRVRWDTKLGFQKNPFNLTISLGSILPQGGQISRIDVIVGRIYPVLYMEKTLDGLNVTRNLRSEEKADSEYRRVQEQKMKMIHDEVWSEMSKNGMEETQRFIEDKNQCSQNDYRKQNDLLNRKLLEKVQAKLKKENLNRRNVSEFLKMKIVDYRKPDYNNPAILSVWNPNEEIISLFSEGKVMSLMNVTISNSSRTYKWLQINTTRQTQYKEIVSKAKYPARKLSPLEEVASKISPVFEEVDLVGIVIVVKDLSCGSRSSQIVYLGDLDFHFVGILFWGNCKEYGWENVLKVGSIVACSNLQWKKSCSIQEVPSLRVNETTVFTENPKHSYLKEEIERLRGKMPEDKNTFLTKCEEKLWEKLEESKWQQQGNSSRNSSSNDSTLRDSFSNSFRHLNGFESKPTASSTPIKPFSLNLKNSTEAEPSPIQKRIEKLKSYGEPPPPLIPFVLTNGLRKYRKKSLKN